MWFEKLTGFKEKSPEIVREKLLIEGDSFVSKANNEKFTFGKLEIPTLEELEKFARLVLEATYEATFFAAMKNMEDNNSNLVYLTLVGGGAFGNEEYWILESLEKVINKFRNVPLDVRIVSYGESNPRLLRFLNELKNKN